MEYDERAAERFWGQAGEMVAGYCWVWTGRTTKFGYGRFRLKRKDIMAHRVSYELSNGPIPQGLFIDHACGNRACVNPEHLRLCSRSQNAMNSRRRRTSLSGFKGVYMHKSKGLWAARICVLGKVTWLGYFDTPEEAHAAYCEAAKKYHGEFANFG